jgi:membrane associated rhomboid family serine protease
MSACVSDMFILLPVGVDYRARRYPVVTFTLMGICVAVYLVTLGFTLGKGPQAMEWVIGNFWLIPAQSHWWTYLTSLFVHEGFFHVAGNMVYLFLFGSCVEDVIGRPRFAAFYLFCGLVSEFTHVAIAPGHFSSEVALGGASGAISGCIGAFLVMFLRTKIEFKWAVFFFFRLWNGEFFLPAWIVISFWFLSDLAGMVIGMAASEHGEGVAFGAHVGGTLCGLAVISIERKFKRPIPVEDENEEEEEARPVQPTGVVRAPIRVQLKPKVAQMVDVEAPAIYLFVGETQYGPYTTPQIQEMFVQRSISADALYWQEGMGEWRSAEELRAPGTA